MFDILPITSTRATDCGPTCLKMLLSYYGVEVDLATLISECNTRLIGSTAKDILRVGRAHGLDMLAWREPAEDVFTQDRPAIVWWKYRHFCVYCGLDDDGNAVICNPDRGRYSVSRSVFKSFYSRVALTNGEPQDTEG